MNLKNIKFTNLIFYYLLILSIKYNICNVSNFTVNGTIFLHHNTSLENVFFLYNSSEVNFTPIVQSTKQYNFYTTLNSLDFKITFKAKSERNTEGSRIEASFDGKVFNFGNEFCGYLDKASAVILKNNVTSKQSVYTNESNLYFELPANSTNIDYKIQFAYHISKKYSCNDYREVIKANNTSNFKVSNLIKDNINIEKVCCNEVNISFYSVDEGYSMINYSTFPINTVFYNPINISENDNIINFNYYNIGCYYLKYNISQENYREATSCKKQFVICYKSCKDCYDCDGNEVNHKCKKCTENHYRKKEDKYDNCYTEDEKNLKFPNYYLNKNTNFFEKCYFTCGKCRILGNQNKHKCDNLCAKGYYPTEGKEYLSNCYNDTNKPLNYYFNSTKNLFLKCYHTCSKCYGYGDKYNNNCEKCANNHHFMINVHGNCIMEGSQPNNYYYDEESNFYKECYYTCKTCSKYKDDYSQGCLTCNQELGLYLNEDYPGNCMTEVPGYYLNSFEPEKIIFQKCNNTFCVECSINEWYFVSNYIGNTFYCKNELNKNYFYMEIFRQNEPLINDSQSTLNSTDIINCEKILRSKRILRKKDEIIIVKKDYINPNNNEIIDVEYYFYKLRNNGIENKYTMSILIDISICDELDIFISIPRNLSNYYEESYLYTVKTSYNKFNYDLLNNMDPFYHDYCTPFYINNSDLTINDRVPLYLPNKLCPERCLYYSLKFRKNNYLSDVKCNCKKQLLSYGNYSPIILGNEYFIRNNKTNIGILKCYKTFFNSFKFNTFNLSLVLYFIILFTYIYLLLYFCLIDNHRFRSRIYESLNNCKSILSKLELKDSSLLKKKMDLYDNNKSKFYFTKIYSLNDQTINMNDMPFRVAKIEDKRNLFVIVYSMLIDINILFRIFCIKSQYEILSLSLCAFIHQINVIIIINSLLSFDNIISYKYIYGIFPKKKIIINICILLSINFILGKFVYKYVFLCGKLMEFLIGEYKNKSLYFIKLHNAIISKYRKIISLFIVVFIFILFGLYYNIIFCNIFIKTQIIWLEQIIIFTISKILIDIFFSFIISIIRFFSFKLNNSYLYNASLIIKGIFNKD